MRHTVLVVDDDPAFLQLIRTVLAREGFEVLISRDGEEAIRLFEQHKSVGVVVADVAMPAGLLGPQVLESVKRLDPLIPCMLMSGHPDDYIRQLCVPGLGSDFIRKPFHPQEFVTKIRRLLDSAPSATPAATAS